MFARNDHVLLEDIALAVDDSDEMRSAQRYEYKNLDLRLLEEGDAIRNWEVECVEKRLPGEDIEGEFYEIELPRTPRSFYLQNRTARGWVEEEDDSYVLLRHVKMRNNLMTDA